MFVFAKKGRSRAPSLRKQIGEKLRTGEYYDLRVEFHKKKARSSGWMKVKAKGCDGALNIKALQENLWVNSDDFVADIKIVSVGYRAGVPSYKDSPAARLV